MKEKILHETYKFFRESNDFNGISLTELAKKVGISYIEIFPYMEGLINEDFVSIQAGENPHIIRMAHYPKDKQLECLKEAEQNKTEVIKTIEPKGFDVEFNPIVLVSQSHSRCIYPSPKYLEQTLITAEYDKTPFTKRIAYGEAQLTPVFFEIDVLERYSSDPRYRFSFEDYSGEISINETSDKPSELKETDQIFLKTFGLGYDNEENRVAVAYLRYLSDMSSEHQLYWYSKMVETKCKMVKEYFNNTIIGDWVFSQSLFAAVIEEQILINKMCKLIIEKPLFRETFKDEKRPKEFTFFNSPTLVNYEKFITVLDKMLSDNINKSFFKGDIEEYDIETISEGVVERKPKGTLRLLEEWLRQNYTLHDENGYETLMAPFKEVRKERQKPAHKISQNYYDKALFKKQMDLLSKVYHSLLNLRYIFHQHRKAKQVQIPKWLEKGEIKHF
ncbi:hypothetical protein [Aurantibacillus circumpalustris]|uniref:hypothetical protein n=1 Tax=Aurantibacillus circumpalustris TaxID=3036359 RepID=UPI00295C1DCD|nr:hypothetical protein [Aurantibacillus circumpalustris]